MTQYMQTNLDDARSQPLNTSDEIDLTDLLRTLWRQRGLILGVMLFAVLAVLTFHLVKASFSFPSRVDYPITLTFLQSGNTYPNGAVFSPLDLLSPRVLDAVAQSQQYDARRLAKSLSVTNGNALLALSEAKLSAALVDTKASNEVRLAATEALEELRKQTRTTVTLRLNLEEAQLTGAQGAALVQAVVQTWAAQAISGGLMNVDISYPARAYQLSDTASVLEGFEGLLQYVKSLDRALSSLTQLSGSQSLIVQGQSLDDVRQSLILLENNGVSPMRSLAYANAAALAKTDLAARVRLASKRRLLELEHERLSKLIVSYDLSLKQSARNELNGETSGTGNGQSAGAQFDQSFLNSLLELGDKLFNVRMREELVSKRDAAIVTRLDLEKEMAVLKGDSNFEALADVHELLNSALANAITSTNHIQQQVAGFVQAYREQTLGSGANLYSADSAPEVRYAAVVASKKVGLLVVVGLALGFMLGAMIALVRAGLMRRE